MDYEDEVKKFLSQPDNLRLALEIHAKMPDVKLAVERKFWDGLKDYCVTI